MRGRERVRWVSEREAVRRTCGVGVLVRVVGVGDCRWLRIGIWGF